MILERIEKANDIKKLKWEELDVLAAEIREFLVDKVSKTGGHLASNLGVVELTMAMHLAFSLPKDKMIWDVGHQSYTHKILTGRKEQFDNLRQFGGMSGFPKRKESNCDAFDTGHSSTSLAAGLGYVEARELLKKAPEYDILVTAECKSLPLVYEMARMNGDSNYIVCRKAPKVYMRDIISTNVNSITTDHLQNLCIGSDDAVAIKGKRVLIVDDVISTGESLEAIEYLVKQAGGNIVGKMAVLAEGDAIDREDLVVLSPLPLFNGDGTIKE